MVLARAGGYLQLSYNGNSPEIVSRIRGVAGPKTLQRRSCPQLTATCSGYLAGRHHDGCRICYLRGPLVLVPPVLKGKCDAGQADSHKYDDENAPCDMKCNIQHLAWIYRQIKAMINLLATDFFFQILAHPVFKM